MAAQQTICVALIYHMVLLRQYPKHMNMFRILRRRATRSSWSSRWRRSSHSRSGWPPGRATTPKTRPWPPWASPIECTKGISSCQTIVTPSTNGTTCASSPKWNMVRNYFSDTTDVPICLTWFRLFSCFFETTQRLILCNATQKCHNSKTKAKSGCF